MPSIKENELGTAGLNHLLPVTFLKLSFREGRAAVSVLDRIDNRAQECLSVIYVPKVSKGCS